MHESHLIRPTPPCHTCVKDVIRKFDKYGPVKEVRIVRRPTGESRGFGFVEMETPEDAKDVVRNMDGAEWNGRNLKVEIAKHPRWVGRWARKGYNMKWLF